MESTKDLNYYKNNCEEDYVSTPISVLRYITELEQALQLQQTGVSTCFLEDYEDHFFEVKYKQVSCCKIAPIVNENYCPNCGKKILK